MAGSAMTEGAGRHELDQRYDNGICLAGLGLNIDGDQCTARNLVEFHNRDEGRPVTYATYDRYGSDGMESLARWFGIHDAPLRGLPPPPCLSCGAERGAAAGVTTPGDAAEPGGATEGADVALQPLVAEDGAVIDVAITWYGCPPYCGITASGMPVAEGMAACGYRLPLGQAFTLAGRTYVCRDRGAGPYDWVDIFFACPQWDCPRAWAWITEVGTWGRIVLLP